MHLEHLLVEQFRCISHFSAELPPGRILIVGDNAKGKTTLLEAIFYLVTGRSFRTRTDFECIPWGAEPGNASTIRGRIRRAGGDSCRLAVTLTPDSKIVRIDDQPLERLAGLWGRLRAVLFTPDDLQLVKGGPANRRRYLDIGLSQISSDYLFHLQRYSQALRQRNALLKQSAGPGASFRAEIEPWDMQLAEHGTALFLARLNFVQALEPRAAQFYHQIAERSGGAEKKRGRRGRQSGR